MFFANIDELKLLLNLICSFLNKNFEQWQSVYLCLVFMYSEDKAIFYKRNRINKFYVVIFFVKIVKIFLHIYFL